MKQVSLAQAFRKRAEELFQQKRSDPQIGWTTEGFRVCDFIMKNRVVSPYDWDWISMDWNEKSMLCLFFAEFLEGETA